MFIKSYYDIWTAVNPDCGWFQKMNLATISFFVLVVCTLTSAIEVAKGTLKNKYRCEKCGCCLPVPIPPPPAKGILKDTPSWNAAQAKKPTEEPTESDTSLLQRYFAKAAESIFSFFMPQDNKTNDKPRTTDEKKNDDKPTDDKKPKAKPAKEYPEDTKYTALPRRGVPMHPYLNDRNRHHRKEYPDKLYNSSSGEDDHSSASEDTSSSSASASHQE